MITANKIAKHFGKNGFDPISFSVPKGQLAGLTGASGCGKTTLLNILTGMLKPDSGSVLIDGTDLQTLHGKKLAALRSQKIGYMMQGNVLLPDLTVLHNLLFPAQLAGKKLQKEQAAEIAEKLHISNILASYPAELSGGEYRRVMLARILLLDTPILLADEPTSNLDSESAELVRNMLTERRENGVTLLIAAHDSMLLNQADAVICMEKT
jgi:putative ABC transport system ATP-binding protein